MSVPYPKTATKPRSQTEDHLAGLASRYIEQRLDDGTGWDEVLEHVKRAHGKTHEQAARGVLMAVLDLEWSGAMTFDGETDRYRRARPGDPENAALDEVAKAVLSLGWPAPDGQRSRTIHRVFLELGGRYRHSDVYWAMHERLKGRELECHRAYWRRLGDDVVVAAKLADPCTPVAERIELERQVEAELVADYVETLDHRVELEYLIGTRRADILDRQRRMIIEAKAYADDVVALGAIAQAMLYRTMINLDREVVDRVAVLLPAAPSGLARQVARTHDLDVDVIWPDGDGFRHEPFE